MTTPNASAPPGSAARRRSRRERRAAATRAQFLSPFRIFALLLSLPLVTCSVALSIYLRTSPHRPSEAMAHLVAMAGCDAARYFGIGPAREGDIAYHKRNDPDGDGVACAPEGYALNSTPQVVFQPRPVGQSAQSAQPVTRRSIGGAKFVRPD